VTLPGGEPQYNPGAAAASVSSAGAADIWGLGTKRNAAVLAGVVEGSFGGGRRGRDIARANDFEIATSGPNAEGPKFGTAEQAMQSLAQLYSTDKAGYIALQQQLYRAGFYGSASPQSIGLGAYTDQTVNAYREAVLKAAQLNAAGQPMTIDEILGQQDAAAVARLNAPKRVEPGFISQYSDPETVAAIAQRAAQEALGRNLSTSEVTSYVKEFHAAEQRWNADRKAAGATAAKGTDVTAPIQPSAQATAETFAERGSRGTEATGNRLADYVNVLRGMVGGDGL
jgi:hypothetical protein